MTHGIVHACLHLCVKFVGFLRITELSSKEGAGMGWVVPKELVVPAFSSRADP